MLLHQVCGKIFHRILKNQWPKFSILKVLSNETKHRFLALILKKWELVKDNLFWKSLLLEKWLCQWHSQLWWTTESKRIDRFSSAWSRSFRFFKIFNLVYYFFNFDQYNGWYNDLKNLAIYLTLIVRRRAWECGIWGVTRLLVSKVWIFPVDGRRRV